MTVASVLFDLDGTLTDPFPGITKSIQYAMDRLGRTVPDQADLRFCIGPPLQESFAQLLESDDASEIDQAVTFYRERFSSTGIYENVLYDDVPECLERLKKAGLKLFVATSKPKVFADRIVRYFAIDHYFTGIYGAELDGRFSDKSQLIAHLMAEEELRAANTVMIGDRKHDLIGAHANNIRAVGVSYGYGTQDELAGEKPVTVVSSPKEIILLFKNNII
ncbi:MAG: HAD family hydrolase [Stappiaceae bacterium]